MRGWIWPALVAAVLFLYAPPISSGARAREGLVQALVEGAVGLSALIWLTQTLSTSGQGRRSGLKSLWLIMVGLGLMNVLPRPTWSQYIVIAPMLAWLALVWNLLDRSDRDSAEQERLLRESRDETLRLKLAPHFLFNALNTMKAQIVSDPQGAASTADRLAALLRQVLDGSGRLNIPLREELAFVEAYLGIERLRLGGRLRVKLEIPEAAEGKPVPPLSLQALVENAVKHGIAPREEGGEIRIWARTEPWGTREKVWVGVDSPLSEGGQAGPGVGLETLRARLRDPADLVLGRDDGLFRAKFGWIDDREPAPG